MRTPILGLVLAAACAAPLAGCIIDNSHSSPSCTTVDNDSIDLDQSFEYTPGVDAGYYITYVGAGQWHLEWTCDTSLSAEGCDFTGTIIADAPPSGANATCYQCEAEDALSSNATSKPGPDGEAQMEIDFDTITTSGVDGVDFTSVPGDTISLDLQVNGLYQPDVVYFVSNNSSVAPTCIPFELTPASS